MIKHNILLFLVTLCFWYGKAQNTNEKPNVVFIISDQHKLEETGAYGSSRSITPNIDELARTGVMFNNAYTPAPVCAPARASLVTGMYPYANGAIYHKAPITMPKKQAIIKVSLLLLKCLKNRVMFLPLQVRCTYMENFKRM